MKLTFSTLACPTWSLPEMIGAAEAHGIEGIDFRGLGNEIDITRHPRFDAELGATLDLLASHHLAVPCLNTSISLVSPAADRWEMMLEECGRYARLAERAHTRFLRIFGGAAPKGMTREEAKMLARRHLQQLALICAPRGCQVLVETHDEWSTSSQVLELLEGFSPDEAAVLWDIEHPWHHGEQPQQTAAALKGWVRHVHFKDSALVEEKSVPRLLGEGRLPLPQIIAALRGIGYDAWICLETEKRWHPTAAPEPEQSLPQFVRYMREHWPA